MGRGIPKASKQIKIVIDRLKKGPAYQSELEKLKVDNRGKTIPHSSMNRILNYYLLYWQLVEKKQEGKLEKWIWRDLPRYKTKSEYEVALKHSHNLIPGLEAIWARIPLETIESKYLDPLIRKKYMDKVEKGKRYVELALNHLVSK
jgi:hypothetical protein